MLTKKIVVTGGSGRFGKTLKKYSNIGHRHNIYGLICDYKGNDINIEKRKEILNHFYLRHSYVTTTPKIWNNDQINNSETIVSKKIKSQCKSLGFKLGTDDFKECIIKFKE